MKKLLMTMSFLITNMMAMVASDGYLNDYQRLSCSELDALAFEKIKEALECQASLEHKKLSVEEVREILDIEGKLLAQENRTGKVAQAPVGYSRILDKRYCRCTIGNIKSFIQEEAQQSWVEILTTDIKNHGVAASLECFSLIRNLKKLNPNKYKKSFVLKLQYELPPLISVLLPGAPKIKNSNF